MNISKTKNHGIILTNTFIKNSLIKAINAIEILFMMLTAEYCSCKKGTLSHHWNNGFNKFGREETTMNTIKNKNCFCLMYFFFLSKSLKINIDIKDTVMLNVFIIYCSKKRKSLRLMTFLTRFFK